MKTEELLKVDRGKLKMLLGKQKKAQKGNRILITITVMGSAGPLRFVVYEQELVASVIGMALKKYAKEGRLPVIGSNLNDFFLHSPAAACETLSPWETIGAHGGRDFMMCKKPEPPAKAGGKDEPTPDVTATRKKGAGGRLNLKSWINKSLSFKIPTH